MTTLPHPLFDYEELAIQAIEVDKQKQKQRRDGSSLSRDAADGGEEFEFRLFASGGLPARNELVRVNIRSPTPLAEQGEGGFVVPFWPEIYHCTLPEDADGEGRRRKKRDEYRDVAVDGQDIMAMAGSTAWVRESSVDYMC